MENDDLSIFLSLGINSYMSLSETAFHIPCCSDIFEFQAEGWCPYKVFGTELWMVVKGQQDRELLSEASGVTRWEEYNRNG